MTTVPTIRGFLAAATFAIAIVGVPGHIEGQSLACAAAEDRRGLARAPLPSACPGTPEPLRLWRIGRPAAVRRAGLTKVADGFVVAGIETRGSGWEARDPRGDPEQAVRVWSAAESLLPLPHDSTQIAGTGLVTPVPLDAERWGLLWGESRPPDAWEGAPPQYVVTHLMFSERAGGEWRRPRELARAGHLGWGEALTLRSHPTRGVRLMVVAHELPVPGTAAAVLFGGPEETLAPLPLPGYPRPLGGSFDVTDSGELVAGIIARGEGREREGFHVLVLTSRDGGRTWTDPELVFRMPAGGYVPRDPRLIIEPDGGVHFLWARSERLGDGRIFHLVRDAGSAEWRQARVPPSGGVVSAWAAGLDRCDRLTLAKEASDVYGWTIETHVWVGDEWTEARRPLPEMLTASLFEGRGADGSWYLGWTGGVGLEGRGPDDPEADARLWVWAVRP